MAVVFNQEIHNQSLKIFKREALAQYDEDKQIDFIRLRYGGSSIMQNSSKRDTSFSRLSLENAPSFIEDAHLRQITSKLDRLEENICKKHQTIKQMNRGQRQKVVQQEVIDSQLIQAQQRISKLLASQSNSSQSPFIAQIKQKLSYIYKKSLLMRRDSIKKKKQIKSIKVQVNTLENQMQQINDKITKTKILENEKQIMKNRQIEQMKHISKRFHDL